LYGLIHRLPGGTAVAARAPEDDLGLVDVEAGEVGGIPAAEGRGIPPWGIPSTDTLVGTSNTLTPRPELGILQVDVPLGKALQNLLGARSR
jgi:hypothetical protein